MRIKRGIGTFQGHDAVKDKRFVESSNQACDKTHGRTGHLLSYKVDEITGKDPKYRIHDPDIKGIGWEYPVYIGPEIGRKGRKFMEGERFIGSPGYFHGPFVVEPLIPQKEIEINAPFKVQKGKYPDEEGKQEDRQ